MRVKGYIRVSTLEQAKEDKVSLGVQKESIINYAKSQVGITPPGEDDFYIDKSSGGRMDDRPELQRLLRDIKNGKVEHLLVWKQDRLSRTALDTQLLFKEFENYNVHYKSVTEPFETNTAIGKVLMGVISSFAEMERNNIKERMLGGRYAKTARDGTNFGSLPPFGYISKDKHYVIVEDEAAIVQKIYELYMKFKSQQMIVQHLIDNDITARIKLDRKQISRILKKIKYTGCMEVKGHPYPQRHPPIISMEMFLKVKAIREANSTGNIPGKWTNYAPNLILRDVAVCGECGRQLSLSSMPSQKKEGGMLEYYRCASKARPDTRKVCPCKKYHRKEVLESKVSEEVINHVERLLSDKNYLRKHLDITSKSEINNLKAQIENKTKALQGKERASNQLLESLEKVSMPTDKLVEKIDSLGKDAATLKEEILRLRVSLKVEKAKTEDFKHTEQLYRDFRSNWAEADTKEKRIMINGIIDKLMVYREGDFKIEYVS
jgi:site-specific DNA recombinase